MPWGDLAALVIDDDEFVRGTTVQQLRQLGMRQLLVAGGGRAAREILRRGEPLGLIVCDLQMPDVDGVELLRDIAETQPAAALILISGVAAKVLRTAQEVAERRGLRVLGCLGKPVRLPELRALLENLPRAQQADLPGRQPDISAAQLRAALDAGEFGILVQPQLCLHTQRHLVGAEALVRWHSPTLGMLLPERFLALVEQYDLLDRLTDVVLAAAIEACSDWHRRGLAVKIAVNFNPVTLGQRGLLDQILALTAAAGLPVAAVVIEVTEHDLLHRQDDPLEALTRMRLRDMELSIDDFGTGHSSLARLRDTPFTELKIDQRFTAAARRDEEARHIVESNIRLAHDLELRAVAEGVETAADLDLMTRLGCDVAQGYHIARPMPPGELVAWARERGLPGCCGQRPCRYAPKSL
ncbi:MAG TPA: EAL domain-containing response regulator [Solimonas sp.]|nr:EAL domain-containing response regulator [Solimonas sp.]